MKDYVRHIYNEDERPKTLYPTKLADYLIKRFGIRQGSKILDMGCGRGDFSEAFSSAGMHVSAVDFSDSITENFKDIEFQKCDFTKDKLPYEDSIFEVIFSKSVVEHLYYPEILFSEAMRVLKPGGLIITMCPAWDHNYRIYFEDFTHRTPFMKCSLHDFHILIGLQKVETEFFKQLPFCWNNLAGYLITECIRLLPLGFLKQKSKLIKFSKETMILSTGVKSDA